MSIIFTHNEDQAESALSSKINVEKNSGSTVYTEIVPYSRFYLAEDYHQKYYLQKDRLLFNEVTAYYEEISDIVASTVAARLNGYAAGYGDPSLISEEIKAYGLSPQGLELFEHYLD